jgi:hypothetical protein
MSLNGVSQSFLPLTLNGLSADFDLSTITINGVPISQVFMLLNQTNNNLISADLNMGTYGVIASYFRDNNFSANKALISDATGIISESTTTSTELGYLFGTTSNIQTQLNNRALSSRFNADAFTAVTSQGIWIGWNRLGTGLTHFSNARGLGDGGWSFDNYSATNTLVDSPLIINTGTQTTTHLYPWSNGNQKITTTYVPTNNEDLTNKLYVDNQVSGFVTTNTAQDISAVKTFLGASSVTAGVNRFPVAKYSYDGTTSDYLEIQADLFRTVVLDYLPLALNRAGGNVAIGKVPVYSSNYKLDVGGRIQCMTELLVENVGTSTLTTKSFNGRQEIEHDNTNALQNWLFGDLRIQHKDGFGVVDYNPITCDGNLGRVGINQSIVSTFSGALNIKAKTPIPTSYTGGLTIEPDTAGWNGSNAIDFVQNFAGGNTQFKIYPALDTATNSIGQLRVKGFGSGTNPSLSSDTLVIQKGVSSNVGVNCEPNSLYGLDVVNDTIRCNDLYNVSMAYGDFYNYGGAQLCTAGIQNELFYGSSSGSFGIVTALFNAGTAFQPNKVGIYEFNFSCWCFPSGATQAIFALRDFATGLILKRQAMIIDPVNGSSVSFSSIITVTSPNAYYFEVTPNASNIDVWDRNLTIKLIKYQ